MSLHNLANELQKKGRGKDKMLMHVTPREVSGLQAIAKANGGSLTVNPDTGLVEAGFLDDLLPSLLPMAAGAALAATGIGAPAAAMLVGGGYGLATGSVEKGLMAGLGAYGGAGLGESLAASAPLEQAATAQQTVNAAQAGVVPQAPGAGTPGGLNAVNSFDTGAVSQAMAPSTPPVDYGISTAGGQTQAPLSFTQQAPTMQTAEAMKTIGSAGKVPGAPSGYTFDQLKAGAGNTFGSLDSAGNFVGQNYGKIGMAAAPAVAASMEVDPYVPKGYTRDPNALRLSKDFQGYAPNRPDPYYKPAGLGYAVGGMVDPLEKMAPGGLAALQGMRDGYGAPQTPDGNIPQFAQGGVPKKPAKAKVTVVEVKDFPAIVR